MANKKQKNFFTVFVRCRMIQSYNSLSFKGKIPNILFVDKAVARGPAVHSPFSLIRLKKAGINQIIDLRNSSAIKKKIEKFFCKLLGIKYMNFKYAYRKTSLPSEDFFNQINHAITHNNGVSYVHCDKGKRRTGICVAIYEKECTNKPKEIIFEQLYQNGFQELKKTTIFNFWKVKKLRKIFNEFLKRYYPERVNDYSFEKLA